MTNTNITILPASKILQWNDGSVVKEIDCTYYKTSKEAKEQAHILAIKYPTAEIIYSPAALGLNAVVAWRE